MPPMIPGVPFSTPTVASQDPESSYGRNFSDMVAPYQDIAAKLNSPYALIGQNSWLAQNHPRAAQMLDSIGLTAAMTPSPQGPEGAGGGISRTFQGLLGAQQYRRQMMLQSAMLPYQMMMPRLQAEDIMSQIGERRSMVPYRMAMEQRAMAQSDYYTKRAGAMDEAKSMAGDKRTDDAGIPWHGIMDPKRGYRLQNSMTGKYADELPEDQQPKFENEKKILSAARLNEDYTLPGIQRRMSQGDPKAQGDYDRYVRAQGAIAGSREGGSQGAPHPFTESKDFLDQERKYAYGTLTSTMNPSQYEEQHFGDEGYWKPGEAARRYGDYQKQQSVAKEQMDMNFGEYRKSNAWQQGVTFQEYMKNPSQYGAGISVQQKQVQTPALQDPYAQPQQPR